MDNLTNYSTLFLLRKSNISLFIYLIINKTVYNKTFSMNIIFFNIWIILITEYDNIETKIIILPKNFTKNNYYCSIQILIKVKIINTWHKYFWNLSTFINNRLYTKSGAWKNSSPGFQFLYAKRQISNIIKV